MDFENTTGCISQSDVLQLNLLVEEDPNLHDAYWLADYFRESLFAVPANRFDLSADDWRYLQVEFQRRFHTLFLHAGNRLRELIVQATAIFFTFRSCQKEEQETLRAGEAAIFREFIERVDTIILPLVQEKVRDFIQNDRFDEEAFAQDRMSLFWTELASCYGSHAIGANCWMQLIDHSLPAAIFAYQAMMNEDKQIGAFQLGIIYERWISSANEGERELAVKELVSAFLTRWREGEKTLKKFKPYYEGKGLWCFLERALEANQQICAAQ